MAKLFQNISNKSKEKLLTSLYTHTYKYPKDRTILSSTKEENVLFYIETGIVEIYKNNYNGIKEIIDTFEDEDLFGTKLNNISGNDYEIRTLEDTTITVIDYDSLINYNKDSKDYLILIKNLYEIMYTRINDQNNQIEILSEKTIRNKLLKFFQIESNKHKSKYIYITEGFSALSTYLATDRSALSRELHNMEKEGFIEIKNKRITLLYR